MRADLPRHRPGNLLRLWKAEAVESFERRYPWAVMKSRLVVCLAVALGSGLGGCKQSPRVDRPAPPADVVTAYVESLVEGRLDPIWVDEWEYAQELERATLGLGLTDAQKRGKARELRARWEHSIVAGRNQVRSAGPMGGSACSYFIRPGATVAVLEAGPPQITPVRVVNFERTWAARPRSWIACVPWSAVCSA